ncbi:alpha/beta hydrolase [Rhodococcus ruber]|uniref:Esterase n=1 Tax=Rhodococcus ruber TaxID=1830 RepID=A0A098BMJ0_9NOCA|nr:alpha/beta hydrolase [Rhodococcus ruber]MDO2378027.1 alpha/beta hydrolase [Rhodococcus ruber]MCD2125974.1 alpha/beta hydrolase [Rhodococcus ruber]MCZ4502216.1 alpha/beta hydrolase [Rhodococcus ruber]MCZ4530045.1 alpha/beta hydrolase [Rhodococcus ruber]MCZ4620356.1 alpha/beta hydrolase [Rhodococcus ruber]
MNELHTHLFGPVDGPQLLALHGLTGHGRRWEHLASQHLPHARVLAPDLRGHGRSPWTPPWNFETHVRDLLTVLDAHASGPVLVVGHSFGGALAVHLAAAAPERVRGLVLLDPAIGLPPERMLEIAELTVQHPDYTDAAEARADKTNGSWGEVDPALLDAELAEHLVTLDSGRVNWRLCVPALVASWSELAREFVLPPAHLPTIVARAAKVQPPYVTDEFRAALADRLGTNLTTLDLDCDHMIEQARPQETAALVRKLM